ncbi:MAG: hypothetical protein WCG83_01160, partial [Candidatus Peregrinibacteria bacterium]
MPRTYDQILSSVFRLNSLKFAWRTLIPTLGFFLNPEPFSQSDRPLLCTMNILPPMMTVWHHFARKALGDAVDIVIFDCSSGGRDKPTPLGGPS